MLDLFKVPQPLFDIAATGQGLLQYLSPLAGYYRILLIYYY